MSNDKPRLVEVTDDEEITALRSGRVDDMSKPFYHFNAGTGQLWANAEQLRAWREARSQHISSGEPHV